MLEVEVALHATVVSVDFCRWEESKIEQGQIVKQLSFNDDWRDKCKYITFLISPIIEMISYQNSNFPSLGEI
jgi:hypothetical protein